MSDLIYKITKEVTETEEDFIFTTINPWCEDVMQRKISKRDLERALALYFNGGTILDKIRAEIEQITDTMGVSYNQYVSKIDVLQIIDKYKAESEETETWSGMHAQITAPKGTFERIFNDADDDNNI